MIQTLRMRDYKCFASEPDGGPVRIELEPLTLLVGESGSGKTTTLQALSLMAELFAPFPVSSARLGRPAFPRAEYFSFSHAVLAEPTYSDSPNPTLGQDGRDLGPTLMKLQVLRDGRFDRIETALAQIVPSVRRLRAVPATVRRRERQRVEVDGEALVNTVERARTGARVQADVRGVGWLDADLLSEGTLLVLALLTAVHDGYPELVLLDDIDRALHPRAQERLVGALREILSVTPDLQIVATTHSPYLVDHFRVEEVRAFKLLDDGRALCRPLHAHPSWERRSGFLNAGEFWAGVGEDWIG